MVEEILEADAPAVEEDVAARAVGKAVAKRVPKSGSPAANPAVNPAVNSGGPAVNAGPAVLPSPAASRGGGGQNGQSASSSSSSAPPHPHVPGPRGDDGRFVLRPSDGEMWTRDEADTLIPKRKGCWISIHSGNSWMISYQNRTTPGQKSKRHAWGFHTSLTHKRALQEVLLWVWGVHFRETGERCPFDIEAL